MACQIESVDTEFLTMVFRAIMGQKLAIWPNISSRWAAFWAAVRRWPAGISAPALSVEGSSVKPRFGAVFFTGFKPATFGGQERCEVGV